MNYSIKVSTTNEKQYNNILVWLTDDNNPTTPNDVVNPTPLHLTYAAMCYKQSIREKLSYFNDNSDQLCADRITEFKEDFEVVTRNIHACSDTDTVAKMMYLVESFLSKYVQRLSEE